MHYPHEREERCELLSQLVHNTQSFQPFLGGVAILIGFLTTATALLDSILIHPNSASGVIWGGLWTLHVLACVTLTLLIVIKKNRRFLTRRQRLILKSITPALICGVAFQWILASTDQFTLAASILTICYGLSILSMQMILLPAIKNLAIAGIIISLSLSVVLMRHEELPAAPHQIADIFLILSIGLPHIAFGFWQALLRR